MRRLLSITVPAVLIVAAGLGLWRWFDAGDGAPANTAPGSALAERTTPVPSPIARTRQTPRPVPITPVAVQYETLDPAFEPLPGARAIYGEYEGGAYQIEVPDAWNGEAVYYAHGFRGNPPGLSVTAPALRQHFIDRGFAWAASSYSRNGYEPGAGARDTFALRHVFEEQVSVPKRSYLYGESMGGHVVTFLLEHEPLAYDGAVAECGVVDGPEVLDYFVSWAALAQYLSGVHFINDGVSPQELDGIISTGVLPALGPVDAPSAAGAEFADVIMRLTGGERPFFREGFVNSFGSNFTIISNAIALAGPSSVAAQNEDTVYAVDPRFAVSADQLNREIERFVPAPEYDDAVTYPEFQPMTGRIERPLLTIHGTGDLLVAISLEQSYRAKVHAAGRDDLLVQRAVRRAGHCNFSREERRRAFDDLVAWVEQGQRPAGEDLTGDLRNAGLAFTSPLEATDPGGLTPTGH